MKRFKASAPCARSGSTSSSTSKACCAAPCSRGSRTAKNSSALATAAKARNGFYDLAVPRKDYYTHAVDWYLAVLTALKIPVHKNFNWLPVNKKVSDHVKQKWPGLKLKAENSKLIFLQPGARWENKRWPAEHFAALVRVLEKKFPVRPLRRRGRR